MKAATIFQSMDGVKQLIADQLYPPRCPSCFVSVEAHGNLCHHCFAKLQAISEPHCISCGIPFTMNDDVELKCVQCLEHPPSFHQARSIWVYNPVSARIIKSLKFEDRAPMLDQFASLMARVAKPFLATSDVIVPVPMHWKGLLVRRYNPSVWLAGALAEKVNLPCEPAHLVRLKSARAQRGLKRAERLKNLQKVFAAPEKQASKVKDKSIILVDDVITTGATANACADALLKAGAKQVNVVTLAHTVLERA